MLREPLFLNAHFEFLADQLDRVILTGEFNSVEKIAKIGRLRAANYSYYFSPSVPKMGTLCTRTLYTHPEPCPPPTYFVLKTFLANFRVLREREIWSGISGWETESGPKLPKRKKAASRGTDQKQ